MTDLGHGCDAFSFKRAILKRCRISSSSPFITEDIRHRFKIAVLEENVSQSRRGTTAASVVSLRWGPQIPIDDGSARLPCLCSWTTLPTV